MMQIFAVAGCAAVLVVYSIETFELYIPVFRSKFSGIWRDPGNMWKESRRSPEETKTSMVVQSARIASFRGNRTPLPSSGGSNKNEALKIST